MTKIFKEIDVVSIRINNVTIEIRLFTRKTLKT